MKTIQILGTGCERCNRLAEVTEQAAIELGLDYRLEKITDMLRFAEFGVMMTPAMAVDGQVKVSGKVPSKEQLKKLLL
jgi:small redox-active disulfide protein 2